MRRTNTPDGLYHNADPLTGEAGTIVTAEPLNALQEEVSSVIEGVGMQLDHAENGQLLKAIVVLVGRKGITHDTTNISPADGVHGLTTTPMLTGSIYYPLYDVPQASRRFQVIVHGGDWLAPLYEAVVAPSDEVPIASHTVATPLPIESAFTWRYCDKNLVGEVGAWSNPTQFTTASTYVEAPTITGPADGSTEVNALPVIQLSAFAVVGGVDTQSSTSVRIKNADGAIVWQLLDSIGPLNNIPVPNGVLQAGSTVYTIEARYAGVLYGESAWSAPVTITTQESFYPDFNANIGMAFGGGYIAGEIVSDYDGNTYGLIVSPGDGDSYRVGEGTLYWGNFITHEVPRKGEPPYMLSDGFVNTALMTTGSTSYARQFVIDRCNTGAGLGGYKDWYIPARDELNLLYRHFKPDVAPNALGNRDDDDYFAGTDGLRLGTNDNASPPLLGHTSSNPGVTTLSNFRYVGGGGGGGSPGYPSGVGADQMHKNSDIGYWSSSFGGYRYADWLTWTENFYHGGHILTEQHDAVYVRAVRRVLLRRGI